MSKASLKTNFVYNLMLPTARVAITLITVPIYMRALGDARYGVLMIAWALLGYFGFLDLGLSRAAINALAKLRGAPQPDRARVLLTVLVLNLGLSLVASLGLYTVGQYVFTHFVSIPDDLRPEVASAFPWLVCFMPLGLVAGVATGAIESRERFLLSNSLQILNSWLTQIVPVAVAVMVSPSLTVVLPATVASNAATVFATMAVVYRLEGPFSLRAFDRKEARSLLNYGGWVTLSNLVFPFVMSAPQLLIGSVAGVAVVPRFTVPMSFVSRLSLIPAQLGRTFFPRMSTQSHEAAHALAARALSTVGYGFAAVCAPAIVLAPSFFRYWIGAGFAAYAGPVAQILFIGTWMGGVSSVAFTLLQAQGRPDLTGKLHIVQVLPFLGLLWLLTTTWGIYGAAIAWSFRAAFDATGTLWVAGLQRSDILSVMRPAVPLCVCVVAGQCIGSNLWVAFPAACLVGLGSLALARAYSNELRWLMDAQFSRARGAAERLARRHTRPAQPTNPGASE